MFHQYYEIHNFCFSITSDCVETESCLQLLYPAMAVGSGRPSTGWTISRAGRTGRGSGTFRLYEAGSLLCETDDTIRLLDSLEWAIMTRILQNTGHCIQLHASGLEVDGAAIIFVGASGSGKSSLALGLILQGWKCLSDEVILLEPGCDRVLPLPRNFHVDSRTVGLFPGLEANMSSATCVDGSGKMRFDPACVRGEWVAGSSAPAWLVFPTYSPGNSNDLVPIGETEAMTLLIGQTINLVDHAEGGLEVLLRLVRNCSCFRFNTGDIRGATLAMSRLVKRQAPAAVCRNG